MSRNHYQFVVGVFQQHRTFAQYTNCARSWILAEQNNQSFTTKADEKLCWLLPNPVEYGFVAPSKSPNRIATDDVVAI
jgi:hypothetical protein